MDRFKEALHVAPAYGRDYPDEWFARCAWFRGDDFKVINGAYVSSRDSRALREDGRPCVVLHYDRMTRWCTVGLRDSDALAHRVQESRVRDHLARMAVAEALMNSREPAEAAGD